MGDIRASATTDAGQTDLTVTKSNGSAPAQIDQNYSEHFGLNNTSTGQTLSSEKPQSSQPSMASQKSGASSGSFNMTQMANNLPPVQKRKDQYGRGGRPRFNPASSPPMGYNLPPMSHFVPPHSMPMPNQNYYMQQPSQRGQYYGGGQIPQAHMSSPVNSRPNMPYYPGHMMVNHQQGPFYYSHTNTYPNPAHQIPQNMVPQQFKSGNPSATDPRMTSPPPDVAGYPPYSKLPISKNGISV